MSSSGTAGGAVFRKHRDYLGEFHRYQVEELGRSPRTAISYGWSLRTLMRWADKRVEDITSDDLRSFKRESSYAPATVQGIVVALRAFHEWGALEHYWPLNGISAVKTPRVNKPPREPVSKETARTLLENCRTPLDYRVVYFGLYAGLRISESAAITEREWRFDRLKFYGKGNKLRSVPLHPELEKRRNLILSAHPKNANVLQSNLSRLRSDLNAVDLDGCPVPSHGLRRTFATTLYETTPYEVVGKILGHGADVTSRYAKIPFDKMEEAVRGLDYYEGEPVQLELF